MSTRLNYVPLVHDAYNSLLALEKSISNSTLGHEILDLVKIRASQMNGCLFCLDMHVKESRIHGSRELKVHHLFNWRESSLFSTRERAALEWTELLTHLPKEGIEKEHYEKLRAELTEKEIAELSFAIGSINFWNRLGVAFTPTPGGLDKILGLEKAGLT